MAKKGEVIRELLSRTDPQGYYIIPLRRGEGIDMLIRLADEYEEAGDIVILRVRGRSKARKIAAEALRLRLLADTV